MRIERLVYACISTFALGECVIIDGAKELVQMGSHSPEGVGSRAAADGLSFHGQHSGPANPNDGLDSPQAGGFARGLPDDLFKYAAQVKPRVSDEDLMDQWAEDARFELPRLPHPDEWKIKTWWIKHWRPIGRKLQTGAGTVLSGLFWPFEFFFKPVVEQRVHPMPLRRLPREPAGVWENFKSTSKQSGITWVNNKLGLGPKKIISETRGKNHEELEKTLRGIIHGQESPVPGRLANPDGHEWRTPKYPPIFSEDPLIKKSYKLGHEIEHLGKNKVKEKLIRELYGSNPAAQYGDKSAEKLEEFVTSASHLKILRLLYLKRNQLVGLHERMQGILNQVVSALGGEKEASETFQQILRHHQQLIAEEGKVADEPKSVNRGLGGKIPRLAFLRQLDPAAHMMHLSPLLLLEKVLSYLNQDSTVALKAASGYVGSTPRLYELRSAAKEVEKYAELSRAVDTLQKKVLHLKKYVLAIRKSDFHDERTMQNIFKDILNVQKINTGIREDKI